MPPKFITFTGVDNRTDPSALLELAQDFPVEFGVLWSSKLQGSGRYPSAGTIARLQETSGLRLSLHICGAQAREIAAGVAPPLDLRGFSRAQINGISGAGIDLDHVGGFAASHGLRAILQSGSSEGFPDSDTVDWLFDLSGGRGALQARWPTAPAGRALVGYAGGLGLETTDAFAQIAHAAGAQPYWIDMESKIRNDMDEFDIGRCRLICQTVYGCEAVTSIAA